MLDDAIRFLAASCDYQYTNYDFAEVTDWRGSNEKIKEYCPCGS